MFDSVMSALPAINLGTYKKIKIRSIAYIDGQLIIKACIKVGSRSLIGANSYVNQDIDDCCIAVGSPCVNY